MQHPASNWSHAILVCAKCSKRLGGGFGPGRKTRLAKALRRFLGLKKSRKGALGVVEVKCLGICPRNAVTVVNGAQIREWLIVPAGMAMEQVATDLGLTASMSGHA